MATVAGSYGAMHIIAQATTTPSVTEAQQPPKRDNFAAALVKKVSSGIQLRQTHERRDQPASRDGPKSANTECSSVQSLHPKSPSCNNQTATALNQVNEDSSSDDGQRAASKFRMFIKKITNNRFFSFVKNIGSRSGGTIQEPISVPFSCLSGESDEHGQAKAKHESGHRTNTRKTNARDDSEPGATLQDSKAIGGSERQPNIQEARASDDSAHQTGFQEAKAGDESDQKTTASAEFEPGARFHASNAVDDSDRQTIVQESKASDDTEHQTSDLTVPLKGFTAEITTALSVTVSSKAAYQSITGKGRNALEESTNAVIHSPKAMHATVSEMRSFWEESPNAVILSPKARRATVSEMRSFWEECSK